jgi:hypothetical protein
MRIASVLLVLLLFMPLSSSAEITEQGTGMLYGADHAFFITAAKGWVLDNESGVKQGLYMTFYPVGYTWANSPAIAYGRKVTKDKDIRSVKDQAESTVKMFHEKGSPNYKITHRTSVALPNGKKVPVYYYAGDQWGNFEAAAYFEEENTINFLVFNCRNKADFDKYLPGFEQMVRSYRSNGSLELVDDNAFQKLVLEANRMSETAGGKEYEERVIKRAGEAVGAIMRSCSSYVGKENVKPFEAIFRIKPDGTISEAFARPESRISNCFEGYFLQTKHPPHQFDSYLLYIDMKIN